MRGKSNDTEDKSDQSPKPASRRSANIPKDVAEWVAKWNNLGLNVDGHAALKGRTLLEIGIFGLWAIRRATGDAIKEVTRGKLAKFLSVAFEVFVKERSLEHALKTEAAKGKVQNLYGITFQVLPDGMALAEQIAGLDNKAVPSTTPPKKSAKAKP